jgi:hypothetical protein
MNIRTTQSFNKQIVSKKNSFKKTMPARHQTGHGGGHSQKRGHQHVKLQHNNRVPGGVNPTTATDALASAKSIASGNRHSVMTRTNTDQPVITRPTQLVKTKQMTVQTKLTADAQLPNAWATTNSQYMDFRIMPSQNIHYVDDIDFIFTVKNNQAVGGSNMLLGPWYQMFDRVELLADGTSTADQLYPIQLFLIDQCARRDEERAMAAFNEAINRDTNRDSGTDSYDLTNYDAYNHGTGYLLAPQEQHTYRFKVGTLLDFADLFLPTLETWPCIRFYFGGKNFQMSGSPTLLTDFPILANAELLLSGTYLGDPSQLEAYKNYYRDYMSISNGIMYDRQIVTPFPINNNSETADIVLTGLSGKVAGIFALMKNQNLTNQAQFSPGGAQTYTHLDKVTFKQQDGTVQSFERQDVDWFRSIMWAKQWPSCLALEKCILWYPFCSDPMGLLHFGTDSGSYEMTTREIFKFTPLSVANNTFTDGDVKTVEFFAVRYGQLIYHRGKLSAFKMTEPRMQN